SAALHIETPEGVKTFCRFEPMTRGQAEALPAMVQEVLAEAGVKPNELDALACTVGPGTFTGVRVGIALVRGMAVVLNKPLLGVTSLEALAHPITPQNNELIAASFDARRDEVYFQLFDHKQTPQTEPMIVNIEAAAAMIPRQPVLLVGTGSDLLAAPLEQAGQQAQKITAQHVRAGAEPSLDLNALAFPQADHVATIARTRFAKMDDVQRANLEAPSPLYIRSPDAKLPKNGGRLT
ncbi:MAG: tRNA (adenosine(37)-N6)-threonylcarbamoyltransferase complex dimerization subunit type 1 TsaB, partial [Parvibaculaceae bacterium]|nr:tRNA (adenosine(37)-N6)-threonylcarbamoyltransferase complex dimerization subunit type 1 TsaB [Parvibaculaceae bacterium]